MSHLSGSSLQLLRSTCSRFFHLSKDDCFSHFGQAYPLFFVTRDPDSVVLVSKLDPHERTQLKKLLQIDLLCNACIHKRDNTTAWNRKIDKFLAAERLHCSGCKVKHPRVLFSRIQSMRSSKRRICVGLEGKLRICTHKTLSWNDIQEIRDACSGAVGAVGFMPTISKRTFICNDSHSLIADATVQHSSSPVSPQFSLAITATVRAGKITQNRTRFSEIRDNVQQALPQLKGLICCHITPKNDGYLPMALTDSWSMARLSLFTSELTAVHDLNRIQGQQECFVCRTLVSCRAGGSREHWVIDVFRKLEDLRSPTDNCWLTALDPDSFDWRDPKGEGITWCSEPHCALGKGARPYARIVKAVI